MEQLFSVFFFFPQSLNSASPNLSCCLCSVLYDDPSGCWPECVYREGGAGKHSQGVLVLDGTDGFISGDMF